MASAALSLHGLRLATCFLYFLRLQAGQAMKLAIMQPYLFPYLGYFQLVAAVDKFVFYDDVNFIKNGWINRNRILLGSECMYLTIPLAGASSHSKINQVRVDPVSRWRERLSKSMRQAYARAPYFEPVNALFNAVISTDEDRISEIAKRSVTGIARYLGLHTSFVTSSATYANETLRGQDRVLDICRREHASVYLNLPGGRAMYEPGGFAAAAVKLRFIGPRLSAYQQFKLPFHAGLSILDVLMFNAQNEASLLLSCDIQEPHE